MAVFVVLKGGVHEQVAPGFALFSAVAFMLWALLAGGMIARQQI